jgi:hypothetical protein
MSESEHLYELVCDARDAQAHLKALNDHNLRLLAAHVDHVISRNGGGGGVPSLVLGLCELEMAKRFSKQL